jgi:chemotaxis protein MotB
LSKKKKHEEHENMERWLVSYADFITMLFCFFTMLYANAPKDQKKIQQIIQGIKDALNGGARVDIIELLDLLNLSTDNPTELDVELQKVHMAPEVQAVQEVPVDRVGTDGSLTDNVVQLGLVNQDLSLVMPERLLFVPGSTELPVAAFGWLTAIAESVHGTPADLQIVGHADAAPLPVGGTFQDNWALASARAAEAIRYLETKGVKPEQLTLGGKVSSGKDPEERAVTVRIHLGDPAAASEVRQRLEDRGLGKDGTFR